MRISDWSSDVCSSDLYSKDRPTGINVNFPQQFSFIDLYGQSSNYSTSHYTNRSVALFGQAGFKITDKLTANAGIRYTWDKVQACAGNSLVGALTVNECDRTAALNQIGRASCRERVCQYV